MGRTQRDQRLKESRGLRAKAPIAAQFEDCFQAFRRLSGSLQGNRSYPGLHQVCKAWDLRLQIWGDGCGASSRGLDYALRNSPIVKEQARRLLEDLHRNLDQAINGVRPQDADDGGDNDSLNTESGATDTVVDSKSAGLEDGNDILDADDQDMDYTTYSCLYEAGDIIGHLFQLLPALRGPLEEDPETYVIQDVDKYFENAYQRLASAIFPKAPGELIERLCYSNLRRHRSMRQTSGNSISFEARPRFKWPVKSGLTPWDRQLLRAENSQNIYSGRTLSNRVESDAGISTAVSYAESVLTKIPIADPESNTSATDSSQPSHLLQLLVLPQPPVDLAKTDLFYCPYCQSELPLDFSSGRMGETEWVAHVYSDLKPYMCTFKDCFHEQKLYGDKEEWFQHEINFHRSQYVWYCGLCRNDFTTPDLFEAHSLSCHGTTSPNHRSLIQEACKRYSRDSPQDKSCVLCGRTFDSMGELGDHLGNHLERFALATLSYEELPEEEEVEDGGMLDEYLAALHRPHEYEHRPFSADNETIPGAIQNVAPVNADADLMADAHVSEDALHQGLGSNIPRDGPWKERVEKYLDGQDPRSTVNTVRHNVPPPYENFVGREEDLQDIHDRLARIGQICIVSGRAGIGKTAIAIQYLHKYQSEYSHVFWVEAETPGLCAEKYGMIASTLKLEERPLADEDARTYLVREKLEESQTRWLLVFDNVAEWANVARYIPRNLPKTEGSVLITTRPDPLLSIPSWHPSSNHQHCVQLDVWSLEHSREFLLTSIDPRLHRDSLKSHDEYSLAQQVVDVVGRLPLAISMIVGYLKVSRCTLADFLEMWEEKEYIDKKKRGKKKIDIEEDDIDATIDSLWNIGIREVRMNSRRLLDILSFLDPENIQKSLLVGDHKENYLEFLNSSEPLSYKRMINELSGRRLLTIKNTGKDEPVYTIHRLLQAKILLDMEDFAFIDAFRKAFRLVRNRFPCADAQQVPNPDKWDTCQEYIPHVLTLCRIYNKSAPIVSITEPKPEEFSNLFYDAGFYVWARQTTAYDASFFLETAWEILDSIQTDENARSRANILCLTGLLLLNSGCYERKEGFTRLQHALKIRKAIYAKHPDHDNDVLVQNAANDYGLCLLNEHQFETAGRLIQDCRKHYLAWGGETENPFEHSKYYGNYSVVLLYRGDVESAIDFQQRALDLIEKFSGKNGMYYRRLFMLGCYHLQAGHTQHALELHLEVLAARLELHGKHHESTILSTYAVGAMYHHLGVLASATEYIQQCIECVKTSKWDRAAFARAQYHLALLYREQGIQEDAAATLEAEVEEILSHLGKFAADCLHGVDDKLMILDDLQPTFSGRYTGLSLLKHLQWCLNCTARPHD